jgi:hypothetical protein
MSEPNREFGDLLTQGLKSIAAREKRAILALEDELGYNAIVVKSAREAGSLPFTKLAWQL